MGNFNEIIIKTLAEQLVRGYQTVDQYGSTREVESPLQRIVSKYIQDNHKLFIAEVTKVFDKDDILNEAIKLKIDNDLKSEYTRKVYQGYFTDNLSEKLQKEIVKDMKILLEGKEIKITIN